ncbi:wax ester/triacylglycerol synthase family O-acyltransferase [Amycolatopsis sp.]|jgi:WS/DGAT/MGAT family acyltransferase|uniref:wax ester/triacylglycerol synthase family O-acyltransferase n=1 Tax=Amycolatopsis sp. TaxID=37632 RepID=UPI002DF82AD3|nr:wax ester/triacylglycerol synthase family O-acyltransferase [Amycolatopsis sp.]
MAGTQLSGLDVAFLSMEGDSTPMHMGAVVTFRPRGQVEPHRLAALLAERAWKIPKLRQVAMPSLFPPGSATWAEDPEFDPQEHIHVHRASGLYEPDPLAAYASRWIAQPLDTRKPLWDLHLVTGLHDGRFALLLKLHHALTDGAGAFAVAAGLLDRLPVTSRSVATPAAAPIRSTLDTVLGTIGATLSQAGEAATIASSVLRATRPYPISPITAPSAKDRSLGFVRLDMGDVRQIRKAHGGTANDVILAVLAGALREWLVNRGHRADGRSLRALIPVSLRGRQAAQTGGNKLSGYLCELPIGVDDPIERLRVVQHAMARNKAAGPSRGAGAFPLLADRVPPALHRLTGRMTGQAAPLLFDTVVTNVPLPSLKLSLDGAPLDEVYPFVPLAPRQALGMAVAVYRDSAHIGLQANGTAVPDIGSLQDAVAKSTAVLYQLSH